MTTPATSFAIAIPQDYFARSAQKDYADDAGMALVREFAQNACDAGAKKVEFTFGPNNTLVVEDDGAGCDDRRMRTKLLVPLESEKEGDSVGGFGKAKELLLFGNSRWVLRTRDLRVVGSLLTVQSYETGLEHFAGFRAEVTLPEGLYRAAQGLTARNFLRYSERPGVTFILDGEVMDCVAKRGPRCVKDFGFAKAYVRKGINDAYVSLRTKGLFTGRRYGYFGADVGQVIIEVTAPSTEVLTPARDWFRAQEHRDLVEGWLHSLSTNARKMLADNVGDEIVFDDLESVSLDDVEQPRSSQVALPKHNGQEVAVSFRAHVEAQEAAPGEVPQALREMAEEVGNMQAVGMHHAAAALQEKLQAQLAALSKANKRADGFDVRLMPRVDGLKRVVVHTGSRKQAKVGMRWLTKNQKRATTLLAAWTTGVRAVAAACGLKLDAVGFTFAEEALAEFVRARNGRFGLLINPMKFDFKAEYQAHEVLDLVLHEAAHQSTGSDHDERFVLGEASLRRKCRAPAILAAIARSLRSGVIEGVQ